MDFQQFSHKILKDQLDIILWSDALFQKSQREQQLKQNQQHSCRQAQTDYSKLSWVCCSTKQQAPNFEKT